jgi:hypothetical protein
VQSDDGAAYGYVDKNTPGAARNAVGLLCRMYLGWKKNHPAMERGVANLAKGGPSSDLYHDYYATQVLHHMEGEQWVSWNNTMRDMLVSTQSKKGHEAGSWFEGVNGGHGADAPQQPVQEHRPRQLSAGVPIGCGLLQLEPVAAQAGEAPQAALMVQPVIQLFEAQAAALQMQQKSRVHRAAAAGHHEPLQRCEAHAGVHAAAGADRRQGTTGPQVAADQSRAGALAPLAPLLRCHLGQVLVAEAMEAVAAAAPGRAPLAPGRR